MALFQWNYGEVPNLGQCVYLYATSNDKMGVWSVSMPIPYIGLLCFCVQSGYEVGYKSTLS